MVLSSYTAADAAITARTVMGEAGNQSDTGKAAVAAVIANRAAATGLTPTQIAQQKSGGTWQFTAWSPKYGNDAVKVTSGPEFDAALSLVYGIFDGTIPDPTDGATNYFNPNAPPLNGSVPSWAKSLTGTTKIGDHFFGRDVTKYGSLVSAPTSDFSTMAAANQTAAKQTASQEAALNAAMQTVASLQMAQEARPPAATRPVDTTIAPTLATFGLSGTPKVSVPSPYGRFTKAGLDAMTTGLLASKSLTDVYAATKSLGSVTEADKTALTQYFSDLPSETRAQAVETAKGWLQGKDIGLQIVASNFLPMMVATPAAPPVAPVAALKGPVEARSIFSDSKALSGIGGLLPLSQPTEKSGAQGTSAPLSGQFGYPGVGALPQVASKGPVSVPKSMTLGVGSPLAGNFSPAAQAAKAPASMTLGVGSQPSSIGSTLAGLSSSMGAGGSLGSILASPQTYASAVPGTSTAKGGDAALSSLSEGLKGFGDFGLGLMPDFSGAVEPAMEKTKSPIALPVAPKAAPKAVSNPSVVATQKALAAAGFDPGPIDGIMGPRTQAAIQASKTGPISPPTKLSTVGAGLSSPPVGGIGGTGPGAFGFAKSTPSGSVGYTTNNGSTTYSTNNGTGTITFNQATGAITGGTGTSAGKVLCTHFYQKGWISKDLWLADAKYGKTRPALMLYGYHLWAVPLVRLLERSPALELIFWPVTREWSKEIARLGGKGEGSIYGKGLRVIFEPICYGLGFLWSLKRGEEIARL